MNAMNLDRGEVLTGGPVLGLDIDGVCVPVDLGTELSPLQEADRQSGIHHWQQRDEIGSGRFSK